MKRLRGGIHEQQAWIFPSTVRTILETCHLLESVTKSTCTSGFCLKWCEILSIYCVRSWIREIKEKALTTKENKRKELHFQTFLLQWINFWPPLCILRSWGQGLPIHVSCPFNLEFTHSISWRQLVVSSHRNISLVLTAAQGPSTPLLQEWGKFEIWVWMQILLVGLIYLIGLKWNSESEHCSTWEMSQGKDLRALTSVELW